MQLILAAAALKRLPLSAFDRPSRLRSGMPEIIRSRSEQFAALVDAESDPKLRWHMQREAAQRNEARECATDEQIAALNRVALWLLWLDREQQFVVMARAFGQPVARIADRIGCSSRQTVYDIERATFRVILDRLKK